jgi:hypothetical protein
LTSARAWSRNARTAGAVAGPSTCCFARSLPLASIMVRSERCQVSTNPWVRIPPAALLRIFTAAPSKPIRSASQSVDCARTSPWNCARVAASQSWCSATIRVPG